MWINQQPAVVRYGVIARVSREIQESPTSSLRASVAESRSPELRLFFYFVIARVSRGTQQPPTSSFRA